MKVFLQVLGALGQRVLLAARFLTLLFFGLCTLAAFDVTGERAAREKAEEEARLAVCHWAESVRVQIGAHLLDVPAQHVGWLTLTDRRTLRPEPVPKSVRGSTRQQVCLPSADPRPLEIRGLDSSDGATGLRPLMGLPFLSYERLELWPRSPVFLENLPFAETDEIARLILKHHHLSDHGTVYRIYVTDTLAEPGVRAEVRCWGGGIYLAVPCDVTFEDKVTGLTARTYIRLTKFPEYGAPVPGWLREVVWGGRRLLALWAVEPDP